VRVVTIQGWTMGIALDRALAHRQLKRPQASVAMGTNRIQHVSVSNTTRKPYAALSIFPLSLDMKTHFLQPTVGR